MAERLTGKDSSLYKSVFMDLDGTITDSGEGCLNGFKHMYARLGLEQPDIEALKRFLGPPVVQHLMGEHGFAEAEALRAYSFYREYYLSEGIYQNRPYEGIAEAIEAMRLSGKSIYVATSKPETQALFVLRHFNLLPLFSGVFGARLEEGISEKNEVLAYAVSSLSSVTDAVMVGDRHYDILGGRSVGFDTVGVLYGYGNRKELIDAGCDYLAENAQDLSRLLGREAV